MILGKHWGQKKAHIQDQRARDPPGTGAGVRAKTWQVRVSPKWVIFLWLYSPTSDSHKNTVHCEKQKNVMKRPPLLGPVFSLQNSSPFSGHTGLLFRRWSHFLRRAHKAKTRLNAV